MLSARTVSQGLRGAGGLRPGEMMDRLRASGRLAPAPPRLAWLCLASAASLTRHAVLFTMLTWNKREKKPC